MMTLVQFLQSVKRSLEFETKNLEGICYHAQQTKKAYAGKLEYYYGHKNASFVADILEKRASKIISMLKPETGPKSNALWVVGYWWDFDEGGMKARLECLDKAIEIAKSEEAILPGSDKAAASEEKQ